MDSRFALLLVCASLVLTASACRSQQAGSERPTATQIASAIPKGASVDEIAYADLGGDGGEEALIAATIPAQDGKHATALVFAREGRGGYAQAFQRRLSGELWLPIRVGRPSEGAPVVAVFASRSGSGGALGYIVVQQRGRLFQETLENSGLLNGNIRFISDGLLESRGDTDRLIRWTESGWQPEDLPSQYLPKLPPDTVTISYFIDLVRGPMIEIPRSIRARVGQHIFLHRTDRGDPSRILFSGPPSAYSVGPDGVITLLQPDVIEIHIEGPAYSGRTLSLQVRVDP